MSIIMVANLDMNNGIGNADGSLLFDLPKDMKFFKSITSKKRVVMGRKTWESLPVRPLAKRRNYVLTMNENYVAEGATLLYSTEEIREMAQDKDVYIIGGAELYYQFIDEADELYITHVHAVDLDARVHFPDFGYKEWEIIGTPIKHEEDEEHEHAFTFTHYKRKPNTK